MKRCNLTLDVESVEYLKALSLELFGKENISQAIRYLVRLQDEKFKTREHAKSDRKDAA